jgi:hypothetical protein
MGHVVLIVDADAADTSTALMLGACGWSVSSADGNDMSSIKSTFEALDYTSSTPKAIMMMMTSSESDTHEMLSRFDMDNVLLRLENGIAPAEGEL